MLTTTAMEKTKKDKLMIARFDTVRYTENLKMSGVPEKQAQMMADALAIALGEDAVGEGATKQDLNAVKIDLKIIKSDNRTIEFLLGILVIGMLLLAWKNFS